MELVKDLSWSTKRAHSLAYASMFRFLLRYRRASLGPLWMIAKPLAFIAFLGSLFAKISNAPLEVFMPHFIVGYIIWQLIGGYISETSSLFKRYKANIYQGEFRYTDLIIMSNAELLIQFLHQIPIALIGVAIFAKLEFMNVLMAIPGLLLIMYTGFLISIIFGILCTRIRDLGQLLPSITQMAFLATPIIWLPSTFGGGEGGKGTIFEIYMDYNPFYQYVEIFRAPLVGRGLSTYSLTFTLIGTAILTVLAFAVYGRFKNYIVYWMD